ncbi:hypothetical protein PENSPDRAFT_652043, partial [Peniophora sp. CONT]
YVPVRYRRLTLALRYLRYLLAQEGHRLVRVAFEEQVVMYNSGVPGWLGDLRAALAGLPSRVILPDIAALRETGAVDSLIKLVDKSMRLTLAHDIATSPRLYLLRDRLEPQQQGPPRPVLLQLREYLKVRNAQDRGAMAKLMVSSHPLALEQLRHTSGVRNGRKKLAVPRELRLCRFCSLAVESPEHALLSCSGSARLTALRADFYAKIQVLRPDLVGPTTELEAERVLKAMIAAREISSLLAAFVRRAFELFMSVELVWPSDYIITVQTSDDSDVGDVVDDE